MTTYSAQKLVVRASIVVVTFIVVVWAVSLLTGCSTSVNELLLSQATDYNTTVVEGVLLPAYATNPGVSAEELQNIEAAVSEHSAFLREVADGR